MMKMKNKAISIVMMTLIGICIFAPIISAETAEEWNEKGIDFARSGEYEKAIEDYNKAIELDPNLAGVYYNRGNAYFYLKQYEKAIEDFDKAIELNPNNAYAYNNRGLAREKLKEQKPIQTLTPTPKENGVPGFEAVFAIAGLLAVAYLLRRRK